MAAPGRRRPASLAPLLPLALAACVEGPPQAGGPDAPLFVILCTSGAGAGPATTMVPARAITVTPRPPGVELSWEAGPAGAGPDRVQVLPGQQCTIYRRF